MTRSTAAVALLGLAAALIAACSAPATTATQAVLPATDVAFAKDVAPLLSTSCAGCHQPGGRGAAKVQIFDATGAVDHAAVSAKIAAVVTAVETGRMPAGGKPKLTATEVGVLKKWQAQGTPNN